MIETNEQNELSRLNAYATNNLVGNVVKNSSDASLRIVSVAFALGIHGMLLWMLNSELSLAKTFLPDEVVTRLEFLEAAPKPRPLAVRPDMPVSAQASRQPVAISSETVNGKSVTSESEPTIRKQQIPSLSIYDETGRIRLPVDFIEKLDQANPAGKRFDFLNPDLELAGTFLKRPPAIEFHPTQFEDAWKPDQDILNELLEKAVEKTTKEIRIPVPGNPTVKLVCKVSVLALGGGCGFVPNGGYGRVIADVEDDPDTLSPEEDRQCQAWWEKISNTRSRREWLKTKELYEISCKKPLAKEKIKAPQGL